MGSNAAMKPQKFVQALMRSNADGAQERHEAFKSVPSFDEKQRRRTSEEPRSLEIGPSFDGNADRTQESHEA